MFGIVIQYRIEQLSCSDTFIEKIGEFDVQMKYLILLVLIFQQALQLGTTELSRYWIYWVPAQYVDAIKDTIMGKFPY